MQDYLNILKSNCIIIYRITYPTTRLISTNLEELFFKIFEINPEKRITLEEMINYDWVNFNRNKLIDNCE